MIAYAVHYAGERHLLDKPVPLADLINRINAGAGGWAEVQTSATGVLLMRINTQTPVAISAYESPDGDGDVPVDEQAHLGVAVLHHEPARDLGVGEQNALDLTHDVAVGPFEGVDAPVVADLGHESSLSVGPVEGGSSPVGGAAGCGEPAADVPTVGEPTDTPEGSSLPSGVSPARHGRW